MSARVLIALCCWTVGSVLLCTPQAAAQDWARKMFKVTSHDFGTVARGAKADFVFEVQNLYREPVHIASVRSSCGCTTPTINKQTLKTWEKAEILAKYNTRTFLGSKGATVTVVIDQPYYAEVQLSVRGYIRSDVVCDPGEVSFGEVDQFSQSQKTVKLNYAGRTDWQILDVRSANKHLEVELLETLRANGRVSYEMMVRLMPEAPSGYFQSQLTILTDDARLKSFPLAVQGRVLSPLTVSPASLFLGVLETGQSVTRNLVVKGKQPFRVVSIDCPDACFKFEALADAKKTIHFIPVTFTAGDAPGKVSQTIKIQTDLGATADCVASATVKASVSAE